MTDTLLSHPFLGLVVSIGAYAIGSWIKTKTNSPLANPLLIATILVIAAIHLTPLTLSHYQNGGAMVSMFIVPATTVLAIQISRQWLMLRENLLPILGGCLVGSLVSIASVWLLGRLFGLDATMTASLLPKSVTTAIAMELSEKAGGISSLTVSAVILTGLISAVLSPFLMRILKLKNGIANGLAMGTSGHAIGTAKAIEMGETEGAFSGIALCVSGVVTSFLYAVFAG